MRNTLIYILALPIITATARAVDHPISTPVPVLSKTPGGEDVVTCNKDKLPWSRDVPKNWLIKKTEEWCDGPDFKAGKGCKEGKTKGEEESFKGRFFDTNCLKRGSDAEKGDDNKPDDILTKVAKDHDDKVNGFKDENTVVEFELQLYTGYYDLDSEACKKGFRKIIDGCKNLDDGGGSANIWRDSGNMVFSIDSHDPERPHGPIVTQPTMDGGDDKDEKGDDGKKDNGKKDNDHEDNPRYPDCGAPFC